jgi:hypothetical protein
VAELSQREAQGEARRLLDDVEKWEERTKAE